MRILVHFEPNRTTEFEGTRLRKTIKGALELSEIEYTTALFDVFDVAHFMSPDDLLSTRYAIENATPVVTSALYTEDDDAARYLDTKLKRDGSHKITLRQKGLRLLNNSNVVMVPTQKCKEELINFGVTSDIKVIPPSVNLARFNFSRDDEKEIFYRYFGEDQSKKLVIALGGLNPTKEGINTFLACARNNPDALFYYIGSYKEEKLKKMLKKYIKIAPKNVKFKGAMVDDLHRSALLNADVVLLSGYTPAGVLSIYEAMAAKCQIIAREGTCPSDLLINGKNAYIGKFSETLVSLVNDYLNNQLQPTIENAYAEVSKRDLETFGKELVAIYKQQISLKKN